MSGRYRPPRERRPVFVGAGNCPAVRHTNRSLSSLIGEAASRAIADAGLSPADIDGLAMDPSQADASVSRLLGLDSVPMPLLTKLLPFGRLNWIAQVGGGGTVSAVIESANALAAGACEYVLIVHGFRLLHPRFHQIRRTRAAGEEEFTLPYGAGNIPPQYYSRYLAKYGANREAMAAIVLNANRNAQDNDHAVWRGKVFTPEDYFKSRFIAYPCCLLDYDMAVNGAAAVVLTTAERARDTPHPGGSIAGFAFTNSTYDTSSDLHNHLEVAYAKQRQLAARLWESAGVTGSDVDLLQLADGFSPMVWFWLEAFGFCGEGEAWQWATPDRIGRNGSHPLNTSGGNLGEGRLHGMPQVCETARQMMGTAGQRQLSAQVGLCQNGGISNGSAFICVKD